jgi:hypothetical protein
MIHFDVSRAVEFVILTDIVVNRWDGRLHGRRFESFD